MFGPVCVTAAHIAGRVCLTVGASAGVLAMGCSVFQVCVYASRCLVDGVGSVLACCVRKITEGVAQCDTHAAPMRNGCVFWACRSRIWRGRLSSLRDRAVQLQHHRVQRWPRGGSGVGLGAAAVCCRGCLALWRGRGARPARIGQSTDVKRTAGVPLTWTEAREGPRVSHKRQRQ